MPSDLDSMTIDEVDDLWEAIAAVKDAEREAIARAKARR